MFVDFLYIAQKRNLNVRLLTIVNYIEWPWRALFHPVDKFNKSNARPMTTGGRVRHTLAIAYTAHTQTHTTGHIAW